MISVFTPTNNKKWLNEAYQSLKAQTYTDWEWIILVNGDERIPEHEDKRVKIYRSKNTDKVGALKKEACHYCSGEWLVELDHDDLLIETCLEEISKCKEDFVYSNAIHLNKDGTIHRWGEGYGWKYRPAGEMLETISPEPYPSNMSRIWFAPNHVRAWRRDFYERIGGHNTEMKISDDHELLCRTYLEGTIKFIDKPLYVYNIHGENSWLKYQNEIQETMWQNHDKYFIPMVEKWSVENGLRRIDLGGAINCPVGYESYDRQNADIVGSLNNKWKLPTDSVGVLRGHDIIEHLKNPIHTMNEAYRVLHHGGVFDILVPSTDGQGAWCDPTHISFWNKRSFRYYTEAMMRKYLEPECKCRFQIVKLEDVKMFDEQIPYVQAQLLAIKDGPRFHGGLMI